MDSTKYLKVGQVVESKNGRDIANVFVILRILDKDYVEIVDGKRRTLNKPKKKKIKHLIVYNDIYDEVFTRKIDGYEFNDAYIRRILSKYSDTKL